MKALIVYPNGQGGEPAHSQAVQTAFVAGGGVNSTIYEMAGAGLDQTTIDYATTNGYDAIIYSYSGEDSYFTLAETNPDIMIFMPSDSYTGDLQRLVLTDNIPSSDDYEFGDATQSTESDSNGYICGQLFNIAVEVPCSLDEARMRAYNTKDSDGVIRGVAIQIVKPTISSGTITAARGTGFAVTGTITRVYGATGYKIYRNSTQIADQTALTFSDTMPDYGIHKYTYRGYNSEMDGALSSEATVHYPQGTLLIT